MSKRLFKITQILSSVSMILALVISPLFALLLPTPAYAQIDTSSCATAGIDVAVNTTKYEFHPGDGPIVLTVNAGLNNDISYVAAAFEGLATFEKSNVVAAGNGGKGVFRIPLPTRLDDEYTIYLSRNDATTGAFYTNTTVCTLGKIIVTGHGALSCTIQAFQLRSGGKECHIGPDGSGCMSSNDITVTATVKDQTGSPVANTAIDVSIGGITGWKGTRTNSAGVIRPVVFSSPSVGAHEISVSIDRLGFNRQDCQSISFSVSETCVDPSTGLNKCTEDDTPIDTEDPPVDGGSGTLKKYDYKICDQIADDTLKGQCIKCATEGGGEEQLSGIWTAVGCIKRDPKSIVERFVEIGMGLGGGVCLLSCLAGGFMITTSQGEPKKINDAKEMITNALIGLLFILFSVVILQFIGVTIFNIPGFGTSPRL